MERASAKAKQPGLIPALLFVAAGAVATYSAVTYYNHKQAEARAAEATRARELAQQKELERKAAEAERLQRERASAEQARLEAIRKAEDERARAAVKARQEAELRIEENRAAIQTMRRILARWDDAVKVAASSPRIALPRQIEALQTIRREFVAAAPPRSLCMAPVHHTIAQGMDLQIRGFLAFLSRNEGSSESLFKQASATIGSISAKMKRCIE